MLNTEPAPPFVATALSPEFEFEWNVIPPSIRGAMHLYGLGIPEWVGQAFLSPSAAAIHWGQTLAMSLIESEKILDTESSLTLEEAGELEAVQHWIRDNTGHFYREGVFRHILSAFEESLSQNTREDIFAGLKALPIEVRSQMLYTLAQEHARGPLSANTAHELLLLGRMMGDMVEGTYLGLLYYGRYQGAITAEEAGETGLRDEVLSEYRDFLIATHDVDLNRASPAEMRRSLHTHRTLIAVVAEAQQRWGDAHPVVRGFYQTLFRGEAEGRDRGHLDQMIQAIQDLLQNIRH